ncbi:MAG: hypothetical protein AB7O24_32675 [Kofleriaceae bacterium]
MTKIKTLIAALFLSTSSAAMAAPMTVSVSGSAQLSFGSRPQVVDHRVNTTPYHQSYSVASWSALSSSMIANNGRAQIRLQNPGTYSWIKLQANSGVSYIDRITLRYADGSRQVLDVNKNLDTRLPLQLAIQNRILSSVVISSSGRANASFQLFGYGHAAHTPTPPIYNPRPRPEPLPQPAIRSTFAEHLSFAGTDGRRFITVDSQAYRLQTVRLSAVSGRVFVKQLLVSYTDGTSQVFKTIDTSLRSGQSLDFKLDGGNKQIARFVVYTDADKSPGELSIFGL